MNRGEHIVQRFVGCVIVSLCLAASASAVMLQEGTQEIQVQGDFDFEGAGGSVLDLGLGWGYFVTDYVELGVRGGLMLSEPGDSYEIGGFGEYHFDIETIAVPYMGGGLSLLMTDVNNGDDTTALVVSGVAGCKIYLVENVALDARAVLSVATDDVYVADDELVNWDMGLQLGLRFYY
jgi:hypothetical protein